MVFTSKHIISDGKQRAGWTIYNHHTTTNGKYISPVWKLGFLLTPCASPENSRQCNFWIGEHFVVLLFIFLVCWQWLHWVWHAFSPLFSAPPFQNGCIRRWYPLWRPWRSMFLSLTPGRSAAWPQTLEEAFQMSSFSTLPMKWLRMYGFKSDYTFVCTTQGAQNVWHVCRIEVNAVSYMQTNFIRS